MRTPALFLFVAATLVLGLPQGAYAFPLKLAASAATGSNLVQQAHGCHKDCQNECIALRNKSPQWFRRHPRAYFKCMHRSIDTGDAKCWYRLDCEFGEH